MSAAVLTEELGPRARRRVQIGTTVSTVVIVAIVAWALWRFYTNGELSPRLWAPFADLGNWRYLLVGLVNTIQAALIAMVLATLIGFMMALGRLSQTTAVRGAARSYIEFFRGIPVLVAILFSFLGLPALGVPVTRLSALVLALTVYNSAVLGEIFRAGILSLDRGQGEAASSIGLTYWQSMGYVILPQAVRRMTPAIVAQLATLTKDTALGFVIGYTELLRRSRFLGEFPPSNILQATVVVVLVYIVLIALLSRLARRLEAQQRRKYGAGRIEVTGGPEDLEAVSEDVDREEARV